MRMPLGRMRSELQNRLGFEFQGPAYGQNRKLINSHINSAQSYVYWTTRQGFPTLRKEEIKILGLGQQDIDIPQDAELKLDFNLAVQDPNEDTKWYPMARQYTYFDTEKQDATPYYRSVHSPGAARPVFFEIANQIKLFPATEKNKFKLKVNYIKKLATLADDNDFLTLDSEPILLLALANLKAHYNHPDADTVGAQYRQLIGRLNDSIHIGRRYIASGIAGHDPFTPAPPRHFS